MNANRTRYQIISPTLQFYIASVKTCHDNSKYCLVADYYEHRCVVLGVDGLHRDVDQSSQQVSQQEEEQWIVVNSLDKIRTPVHGAGLRSLHRVFG